MGETLRETFDAPLFRPWAHEADRFLEREARYPLERQLRVRHVREVVFDSHLGPKQARLAPIHGHFLVRLSRSDPLEELARSLGHELGHTFHYHFPHFQGDRLVMYEKIRFPLDAKVEEFCDEFMRRWISVVGLGAVCEQLARHFPERSREYESWLKRQHHDPRQNEFSFTPTQ